MNILMVAAEVTPLVKVGGLADVVGALPQALSAHGHEARVIIPRYGQLQGQSYDEKPTTVSALIPWQGGQQKVQLYQGRLPGSQTVLYTIDAGELFAGGAYINDPSPAGFKKQMERFTFFSWAVTKLLPQLGWPVDIVHCHDWHAAGVPLFLSLASSPVQTTVFTIHNIESQGKWGADEILSWVGLQDSEHPSLQRRDAHGDFNLLQQAIHHSSAVTTVSPTYARELRQPEFGLGLEQDIIQRAGGVTGILNGLDTERFNPANDPVLAQTYDQTTVERGKAANREKLFQLQGWAPKPGPFLGMVSRLTVQKGVDLLISALPDWVKAGGQVMILGSGHPAFEQALQQLAQQYPESIAVTIGFDAKLAQLIYAGSDFFAMPSKFEPCGLGQLLAMRYGTLPIVRDTGGLHDTVIDLPTHSDQGTGFVFRPYQVEALQQSFQDALRLWAQPDILTTARQRAMSQDFSWTHSAQQYLKLYGQLKN